MAKPEGALELGVEADLSFTSFNDAQDILVKHLMGEKVYGGDYSYLKIPSQLFNFASQLSVLCGIKLEISSDYNCDEWSYHSYYLNKEDHKFKDQCVWSPGA